MVAEELDRVSLMKLEWILRLGIQVDANHIESSSYITGGRTPLAAEQIEQLGSSFCVPVTGRRHHEDTGRTRVPSGTVTQAVVE